MTRIAEISDRLRRLAKRREDEGNYTDAALCEEAASLLTPAQPANFEQAVEVAAIAMENAEVGFSINLIRLVDGVSTYRLEYSDGETLEFGSTDEVYQHVAEKKRVSQATAALRAALPMLGAGHENINWSRKVDEWMGDADISMSQSSYRGLQSLVASAAAHPAPASPALGEITEEMVRAAYEDWIADVCDLEPSWEQLPQSHKDRLRRSLQAASLASCRQVEWRLIERGETIEADDEVIADDAASWVKVDRWAVGAPYHSAFKSIRRALPAAPAGGTDNG